MPLPQQHSPFAMPVARGTDMHETDDADQSLLQAIAPSTGSCSQPIICLPTSPLVPVHCASLAIGAIQVQSTPSIYVGLSAYSSGCSAYTDGHADQLYVETACHA